MGMAPTYYQRWKHDYLWKTIDDFGGDLVAAYVHLCVEYPKMVMDEILADHRNGYLDLDDIEDLIDKTTEARNAKGLDSYITKEIRQLFL